MDKTQMRQELRKILHSLSTEQIRQKSRKACENLISTEHFRKADVLMMYLPLEKELDVSEAILHAWQMGKTVTVPKVLWEHRHMIPVEIKSLDADFDTHQPSGLRNPVSAVPIPLEQIDLVITPGLGFDRKGNRLGRGASFYDRFFAGEQLRADRCGLAFAEQMMNEIPVTEKDQPVDFIVTDKEIIYP